MVDEQAEYFDRVYKRSPQLKDIRFVVNDEDLWQNCTKHLKQAKVVADFGCGSGTLLYNVAKITNARLIAIEQSDVALQATKNLVPRVETLNEDVLSTSLKNTSIDFALSRMAIEHVDDKKFLSEVYRVLRAGGYFWVVSVVKQNWAWYFYKNAAGETVIEPTHLREYKSVAEFEGLLQANGFSIVKSKLSKVRFSLVDPFLGFLIKFIDIKNFLSTKPIEMLRLATMVPIPGYYAVEVLAQKRDGE